MPGTTYNPDHTAHIRALIKQMVIKGISGLVMTALVAGAAAIIGTLVDTPPPSWLVTPVWMLLSVLAAVSLLALVVALVFWLIYLARRRELDAQGAEVEVPPRSRTS